MPGENHDIRNAGAGCRWSPLGELGSPTSDFSTPVLAFFFLRDAGYKFNPS